jgi:hypothetical protein
VTDVRGWLARRAPEPPPPLRRWLEAVPCAGAGLGEALLGGALVELGQARAAPGRVRESAFHLLAADALVTYACEAALDDVDPVGALGQILGRVAAAER